MLQFLVESPYEKKLYRLESDRIVIGRLRTAEIPLLDEGVRKRHVLLARARDGYRFQDLERAGLRHNGDSAKDGILRVGDRLTLGSTTITLQAILPSRRPPEEPPGDGKTDAGRDAESAPDVPQASRSIRLDPAADDAFLVAGFRSVLEINRRLLREGDETKLLGLIMDAAIDLTGADRGFLLLERGGELRVRVAHNMEGDPVSDPELEISRTIAMRAIESRRAVLSSDVGRDERFDGHRSIELLKLRAVLSVPLLREESVLGALYVDHRFEEESFAERHVGILEAFANQAAIAIVNSRLTAAMKRREEQLRKKNIEVERLNSRLSADLDRAREDLQSRQRELEFRYDYSQIVGRSEAIRRVLTTLDKVTDVNVPVFIEGESGTGKELIARALHFNGPRREADFVSENCSAVPETLIEKVLFGHVRGAFTGADEDAPGLFEQAHGGTLFLDEVGDMGAEMQKKILRVLQEGEIRRVGGKRMIPVDARIVCATNRDIDRMRDDGEFREDLFWRLVVVRIRVPPLRERAEDIPMLVDHFLGEFAKEMRVEAKRIESGALDLLVRYPWPGNVRELGNEMRRAVALAGDRITVETLSERIRNAPPVPTMDWTGERPLKEIVEEVERSVIMRELDRHDGNKTRVAAALGLSRLGLRNKMTRYGLE